MSRIASACENYAKDGSVLIDNEDAESFLSDLKSARLKLATLKLHDKLENIHHLHDLKDRFDAHKQLDSELEAIINLETNPIIRCEIKPRQETQVAAAAICSKVSTPHRKQVDKIIQDLVNTFSLVFQALLVLSNEHQMPNCPLEGSTLGRRSRDFDVRLKRNAFDLKQQHTVLSKFVSKLVTNPDDCQLLAKSISKLLVSLRCLQVTLQFYLHHLPLSDGYLYPPSIVTVLNTSTKFIALTNKIGFDTLTLSGDIEKLSLAAQQFQDKIVSARPPKDVATLGRPAAQGKRLSNLILINNLAREKFGSPQPKKSNSRKSPSLPRPRSATSEKSSLVRPSSNVASKTIVPRTESPVPSIKCYSENVESRPALPSPKDSVQTLRNKISSPSVVLHKSDSNAFSSIEQHLPDNNVQKVKGPTSFKESKSNEKFDFDRHGRFSLTNDSIRQSQALNYCNHFPDNSLHESEPQISRIELPENDLRNILKEKRKKSESKKKLPKVEEFPTFESIQVVSNLSSSMADEILLGICHEMMNSDLISKLIIDEFKV